MELREYRYFLAVAKEESITKASELLHISQPGLSKVIMNIEQNLGKKLFIRKNRKISLTEDGIILKKRAQEIIELDDKIETEFMNNDNSISGDIFIGGGETEGIRLLAKVIKKLNNNYPNIHYHFFSGNSDDVTEKLDSGLLDFGILIEPVDIKKYDSLRLPSFDSWGILMRKDSPLAKLETIEPKDLTGLPLICSRQPLVKDEISSWSGINFENLNIIATYNLIYNASLLVEEGLGYALCLDKLINTSGNSNLCFKPLKNSYKANSILVWKKYQIFSKASQEFLKEVKEQI